MRALAAESGVAYKTLFDVYGSKDNLLATAVEDRLAGVFEKIIKETKTSGFERLLEILDRSSRATLEIPNLARALEPILAADPGRFSIKAIYDQIHRQSFEEMDAQGGLADWADIDMLLDELMLDNTGTRLFWANGVIVDDDLALMQQFGACKILLPATIGVVRQQVEQAYRRLQAQLSDSHLSVQPEATDPSISLL